MEQVTVHNLVEDSDEDYECLQGYPFWLLFLIIFLFCLSVSVLSVFGLITGILAKREAKRIEEEYEDHPDDEFEIESLDEDQKRELAEMYDVVPDELFNRGHDGYDTVTSLQDYRNSLTQIEEENESVYTKDDFDEEDEYVEEISDTEVHQDDHISERNDASQEQSRMKEFKIEMVDETSIAKRIDDEDDIPFMDDSVSDSEASVHTVIEVSKPGDAKAKVTEENQKKTDDDSDKAVNSDKVRRQHSSTSAMSEAGQVARSKFLPKWQSEGRNLGLLNTDQQSAQVTARGPSPRIPRYETNKQIGRSRSPRLSLASASSGLSMGSSGGWHDGLARSPRLSVTSGGSGSGGPGSGGRSPRMDTGGQGFVYPRSRKKSQGAIDETTSIDSTVDSVQSSIHSETSLNFRGTLRKPDLKRTNSNNKAAFVLRLLSRPEDFEDGIKEFSSKPKEIRSPTGRKISEWNRNRLSVPDVVLSGRSLSNTSAKSWDGREGGKPGAPTRGEVSGTVRNLSLETMLTGTISKMLAKKYERAIRRGSNYSEA